MAKQKKNVKKKDKGIGDTIERITKKTGIKKVVEWIAGEDCGCDERKDKLNKLFPYNQDIKCLEENEYVLLKDWFGIERSSIKPTEQQELRKIYNRVFNKNSSPTGCASCVRDMVDRLRQLYTEYEKQN